MVRVVVVGLLFVAVVAALDAVAKKHKDKVPHANNQVKPRRQDDEPELKLVARMVQL